MSVTTLHLPITSKKKLLNDDFIVAVVNVVDRIGIVRIDVVRVDIFRGEIDQRCY
jgi:hypothetical protein